MQINRIKITGIFGNKTVDLPVNGRALIIVGPNGIGKSTVLSIFYLFLSKQWQRLLQYEFRSIHVWIDGNEYSITYYDVVRLNDISLFTEESGLSPRLQSYVKIIEKNNKLYEFLGNKPINEKQLNEFAKMLNVPINSMRDIHRSISYRSSRTRDLFDNNEKNRFLATFDIRNQTILYLPTYRRIEKDLSDIFPEVSERNARGITRRIEALSRPGFSGDFFSELVQFGMDDVKLLINESLDSTRSYSLQQYNNMSAQYLKDVILNKTKLFDKESFSNISSDKIRAILSRVPTGIIDESDIQLIIDKIQGILKRSKGKPAQSERFFAHYVSNLININYNISEKEKPFNSFARICNKYFGHSKLMSYDELSFQIKISAKDEHPKNKEDGIDLGSLSSGEKQIISTFAHLIFGKHEKSIVIIDEPELSLSVAWQEMFLPDIASLESCSFLFVVTHSPFIFDNEMRNSTIDLQEFTQNE